MKQSERSTQLEEKFLCYIKEREFFWLSDVRKDLSIVLDKKSNNYDAFWWVIKKLKRQQKIQPCDSRGSEKQYQSLIFER